MAWIMFWFLLAVFVVLLFALLYSAFDKGGYSWIAFGSLDGIVGDGIRRIVAYLFPSTRH